MMTLAVEGNVILLEEVFFLVGNTEMTMMMISYDDISIAISTHVISQRIKAMSW